MNEIQVRKRKAQNCGVRLTTESFNIIKAKAITEGVSISEILRAIVDAWIKDQK